MHVGQNQVSHLKRVTETSPGSTAGPPLLYTLADVMLRSVAN